MLIIFMNYNSAEEKENHNPYFCIQEKIRGKEKKKKDRKKRKETYQQAKWQNSGNL